MKTNWLDRRIAAPGPHIALCLTEAEFKAACRSVGCAPPNFMGSARAQATAHIFDGKSGSASVIVCMQDWQGRDPIEVAGLLVHEAVHVWQEHASAIGEHTPGAEQEAYAIQAIAQELMAEFARRMRTIEP